jgi:prepilin-type N-terminal cleavage/methylation domain-containing protein
MAPKTRRAFTLIELLTVIAIIAVLAALLMPVFSRAREAARQTTCMSNMKRIHMAVTQYNNDYGEYPAMLLGPAEAIDTLPWLQGGPAVVSAKSIKHGFLYPAYLNDIEAFHCPDDPDRDLSRLTTASYPASSPWNAVLNGAVGRDYPNFDLGGINFKALPPAYKGQPIAFYAYDSYDISSLPLPDGTRSKTNPSGDFQIVYSRDWTAAIPRAIDPRQDAPNQLQYRNPPQDKSILTWCNYHVTTAGGNQCPYISLGGTAKTLGYNQLIQRGWNVLGP